KRTINILSIGRTETKTKKLHPDSPSVMNIPALMGKRDALYEKAMNILKTDIIQLPINERSKKYEQAFLFLISGIETSRQIHFHDELKNKEQYKNSQLDHYMIFLADTVQTTLTLCNHQLVFYIEKENVKNLIGKQGFDEVEKEDIIFSESEKKVFECIKTLIQKSENSLTKYREIMKRSMTKEDESRYKKAFIQFLAEPLHSPEISSSKQNK
ncbi:MAG TPA: hypothetical protein PLN24_09830, partial [Victivallales bacterium]|nr:hypothetical protein [Victivallales bacterium]